MSIRAMTALAALHSPVHRGGIVMLLTSAAPYCNPAMIIASIAASQSPPRVGKDLVRCTGRTSCEA